MSLLHLENNFLTIEHVCFASKIISLLSHVFSLLRYRRKPHYRSFCLLSFRYRCHYQPEYGEKSQSGIGIFMVSQLCQYCIGILASGSVWYRWSWISPALPSLVMRHCLMKNFVEIRSHLKWFFAHLVLLSL
jgi:hypothetical protein